MLFQHATTLLTRLLADTGPADKIISRYFHEERQRITDRRWLAETVYGVLRRKRSLEYSLTHADQSISGDRVLASYLALHQGWSGRALTEGGYSGDATELLNGLRAVDRNNLPLAVELDLSDELCELLLTQYGECETRALARSLQQAPTIDLRTNTLKTTPKALIQILQAEDIVAHPTLYAPTGVRLHNRRALFQEASFQNGLYELQDEGSQLVSLLLEAKPREHVVDFCAGAGGKTLHLAALMENRGQIIACDVSKKRLANLHSRLKRAGVDNVHPQLISDENDRCMKKYHGKMERVLVDAPCSGSGTLRRNPDMKWRPLNLESLIQRQQSILAAAAPLVKPGGRLVYATCSLLTEENEEVITGFLNQQTAFRLIPVAAILARLKINLADHKESSLLRLLPHHHATDGFFAAVLERQIDTINLRAPL